MLWRVCKQRNQITFSNGIFYHFKFCHNRKKCFWWLLQQRSWWWHQFSKLLPIFQNNQHVSFTIFMRWQIHTYYIHTAVTLCKNPFKMNSNVMYGVFQIFHWHCRMVDGTEFLISCFSWWQLIQNSAFLHLLGFLGNILWNESF